MFNAGEPSEARVLTDHRGWPVAVNEGSVWWMVSEIEPADAQGSELQLRDSGGGFFELQLANGQVFIAARDAAKRHWTIASRKRRTNSA